MKLRNQRQFTTRRRKASKKRFRNWSRQFLVWVSALTAVFSLVKLVVEIIQMIHH